MYGYGSYTKSKNCPRTSSKTTLKQDVSKWE